MQAEDRDMSVSRWMSLLKRESPSLGKCGHIDLIELWDTGKEGNSRSVFYIAIHYEFTIVRDQSPLFTVSLLLHEYFRRTLLSWPGSHPSVAGYIFWSMTGPSPKISRLRTDLSDEAGISFPGPSEFLYKLFRWQSFPHIIAHENGKNSLRNRDLRTYWFDSVVGDWAKICFREYTVRHYWLCYDHKLKNFDMKIMTWFKFQNSVSNQVWYTSNGIVFLSEFRSLFEVFEIFLEYIMYNERKNYSKFHDNFMWWLV